MQAVRGAVNPPASDAALVDPPAGTAVEERVITPTGRRTVEMDLPCPRCGDVVQWLGKRTAKDDTGYVFAGGCSCMVAEDGAA